MPEAAPSPGDASSPASLSLRRLHVIANVASGQEPAPIDALRDHLATYGFEGQVHVVEPPASLENAIQEALAAGADALIACGGDGTVTAVAQQVAGTDVPMAILPQGTANILATELKVPEDPEILFRSLAQQSYRVRPVDLGVLADRHFMLRVHLGLPATMTVRVPDDLKQRFGQWGYLYMAWRLRQEVPEVDYRFTIDGETHTARGVSCTICNTCGLGLSGAKLLPDATIDDGRLHLVVFRRLEGREIGALAKRAATSLLRSEDPGHSELPASIQAWSGTHIRVEADRPSVASCDGEELEVPATFEAHVRPHAVRVLIPATPDGTTPVSPTD